MTHNRCGFLPWMIVWAVGCGGGDSQPAKSTTTATPAGHATSVEAPTPGGEASQPDHASNIPDKPVSGQLNGKAFNPDLVTLENGILTLRQGQDFFADSEIKVFLFDDTPDKHPTGTTIHVEESQKFGIPHIHASWKANDFPKTEMYLDKYRMTLEFGPVKDRRAEGRIDLHLPDAAKSFLTGAFTIEIPRDWTEPPTDEDVPYVQGTIVAPADGEFSVTAGYVGCDAGGNVVSNGAGTTISTPRGGSVSSTTFQPRVSTFTVTDEGGTFAHRALPPGIYLLYVRWDETWLDWRWIEVGPDARESIALRIDPDAIGGLELTMPADNPTGEVVLLPLRDDGSAPDLPGGGTLSSLAFSLGVRATASDGIARFPKLRPGKYRAFAGERSIDVEVKAGETATGALTGP